MSQQLEDFYSHLNEAVMTTNDFSEGIKFRKREKVDQFSYCGLNQMYKRYLSFDLDIPGSAYRFDDLNLPTPTIITINPTNAHCHYLYHLKTPVAYHNNSRTGPQDYFEAIQKEMENRLRADTAYNHTITKNPLNDRWRVQTFPTSYDLSDFLEYIDLPKRGTVRKLTDNLMIKGRNDELFHTLRLWAYIAVHNFADGDRWDMEVFAEAMEINSLFDRPLPMSEIKSTAKSVSRGVWRYRHQLGKHTPKVLKFTDETATQRMSLGAEYTNAIRVKKSLESLQKAKNELQMMGHAKISISKLVAHSGMNIKTVRKYFPQLY